MMTCTRAFGVGFGCIIVVMLLWAGCPVTAGDARKPETVVPDETQLHRVLAEAHRMASLIRKRNGKGFIVIDKRNFQFYQYGPTGDLRRIGPAAIGKGKTREGDFETPVGIYTITSKESVADGPMPERFFRERNMPVPPKVKDRKVPGAIRFKLVVNGITYIHYCEVTGGRLTDGSIGLDWEDAEAVFFGLEVGSYCVIIDDAFLERLERGELPVAGRSGPKPAKKPKHRKNSRFEVRCF